MSETHSRGKHGRKGEARISIVGTRLPYWVEFWCEKLPRDNWYLARLLSWQDDENDYMAKSTDLFGRAIAAVDG